MLKGIALNHFYYNHLNLRTYKEACAHLRGYYEGPGYHRRNLDLWNNTTLTSVMAENPDKSTLDSVQALIEKLRQLQFSLSPDLRTDGFFHNKLVTACEGSLACRYAVSDPPADTGMLINKLQSSIMAYEKEQNTVHEAFYTDRRYRTKDRFNDRNRQYGRKYDRKYGRQNGRQYDNNNDDQTNRQHRNRCFVCKKEGCRSWKHPQQEQDESKARFRSKYLNRFNNRSNTNDRSFYSHFNEAFTQYVADFEGDTDEDDDSDMDTFETYMTNTSTDINNSTDNDNQEATPDTPTSYFTSVNTLISQPTSSTTSSIAESLITSLTNQACIHQLTTQTPNKYDNEPVVDTFTTESTSRYGSNRFFGVVIDTGASIHSTAGQGQFQALQRTEDIILDESTKGMVTVQFGIGTSSSIGSTRVNTPIGQVEFHVMPANTPFLLSLADMDKLKVYFNNLTNTLITPHGSVPVVRRFGHSFLLWDTSLRTFVVDSFDYNPCFLTNTELQRLHRRFGHPSVSRLQKVLERAGHDDVDKSVLEYLTKYCVHCQRHGQSPGRFKFNLKDDVHFNYSIIVDVFYITGKPVLHVVDESTRYQAGRWLQNISAKHTWDTLRMCWIDTYLGPPDQITTDAGKNFASKEFNQYANMVGTKVKIVPVEAHNSVGTVERYHGPVRRAYTIITAEIRDIDREMALQMAFKAINDSAGPDGLIPTLLVYGAYPRMTEYDPPAPSITQRAMAIKKAMNEIQKLRAKRQVADALNTRNGPNTNDVHQLTLNADVMVWREGNTGQSGSWNGPYKLVGMDGESCVLALPNGNTTFRSTSVKPYLIPDIQVDGIVLDEGINTGPEGPENDNTKGATALNLKNKEEHPTQPAKQGRGRPRKQPLDTSNTVGIVVDTATAPIPVKRGRGRPRKYAFEPDVTVFL
jgi:hypothetical protein